MNTILTLIITVYVPLAGGINGGTLSATGQKLQTGHAACGYNYDFGTVFVLPEEVTKHKLPNVVTCIDRGSAIRSKNLDIALVSPSIYGDLRSAFRWGKRKRQVEVFKSMTYYRRHKKQMDRIQWH